MTGFSEDSNVAIVYEGIESAVQEYGSRAVMLAENLEYVAA